MTEYALACAALCAALLWPVEEGRPLLLVLAEYLTQFFRNALWLVSID
jgi:hypothetical protein